MVDPFVAISRFLFDQALRLDSGKGEAKDPAWPEGTRLNALVRAVGDPTRALLQIGDQMIEARLPTQPKVGERLALRVIEPFPRLVFALEGPDEPLETRGQTQVNLSNAGRILGDIVGRQQDTAGDKALRLTQALPLPEPTDTSPHGEDIARTLRQGLEKSGLFYEKHQARWVTGDYPLTDLKQEPQAQRAGNAPATAAAPLPAPGRDVSGAPESLLVQAQSEAESPAARAPAEPRNNAESPMRGQLELLDGRGLTVALPAWEGREMQWELPEREGQGDEEVPAWSTRLAVDLPHLGPVQAQLRIHGDSLALSVSAASPEGAEGLRAAQHDLMQALRDAGISLTQLSISHG